MAEMRTSFPRRILVAGGVARSLILFRAPLLQAMVDAGHKVATCAGESDARVASELRARGVAFYAVPVDRRGVNPRNDLAYFLALRSVMADFRPDVFLAYTVKPVVYGSLMASHMRIPRIAAMITGAGAAMECHDASVRQRLVARLVRSLYRRALRRVDTVFFQNQDDESLFRTHAMLHATRVVQVQGSGVDLDYFQPAPPVLDPVTFLLAARLLPEKGVREYVEAARTLRARFPHVRCILVGPLEPGCGLAEEEVRAWHASGTVEYFGSVLDVRPALASASVFVLPSYYPEGRSRAIQEAMAMARPIITTDWRGCRESVENGVNGWTVPVQDAAGLAETMSRFVQEPARIAAMGSESRRLAEELYDVKRIDASILGALGLTDPAAVTAGVAAAATATDRKAA